MKSEILTLCTTNSRAKTVDCVDSEDSALRVWQCQNEKSRVNANASTMLLLLLYIHVHMYRDSVDSKDIIVCSSCCCCCCCVFVCINKISLMPCYYFLWFSSSPQALSEKLSAQKEGGGRQWVSINNRKIYTILNIYIFIYKYTPYIISERDSG